MGIAAERKPDKAKRRARLLAYAVLCGAVALLVAQPLRYGVVRLLIVGGGVALWAGALLLTWRRLPLRLLCIAAVLGPALALVFFPEQKIDGDALRAAYLRSLRSYEGTPYVWGGEARTGIDCSGLIRMGLIDAEYREGLRTRNIALLRKAAWLWWDDSSARALGDEYRGRTVRRETIASLNQADYDHLRAGDIAVTSGGQHILAYLGDRTWIQADPKVMKTVLTRAPSDDGFFAMQATLLRWRVFGE